MASDEEGPKKHPCQDCRFCQWCSDDRCRVCRPEKRCARKLSTAEQIELYERLNSAGGKGEEAAKGEKTAEGSDRGGED